VTNQPGYPLPSRSARGIALTEIGIGTAQFGNLFRETTDAESVDAVESAWARGVRYFDTAPHYGLGLAETRLGLALAGRPRDQFVVSTKVGRLLVPSPETAHEQDAGFVVPASTRRVWDFSRDGILRSIEASLERLGLDRIDVVYMHDPDDHWRQASEEGAPALAELRDQGIIGAFGVGMNQSAMLARFIDECDVDVVMVAGRYTLLEQGASQDLFPIAAGRGVAVVAAAIYNSGLLSRTTVPDGAHYNYRDASTEVVARAREIALVCEEFGVTLPDAAVQFPLRNPSVTSVVVGARTAEQVIGTIDRYERGIPEQLWSALVSKGLINE
jgi:D-threo-aldose 1-dehydrogenase